MNAKVITAIVLFIFGVAFLLTGIFVANLIATRLEEGIEDAVFVYKYDASDFADWTTNEDDDDAPKYNKHYIYNITNLEAVLAAATRGNFVAYSVEELGPYTVREFNRKISVSFNYDRSQISFQEFIYKFYEPTMSITSDGRQLYQNDQITNVWIGYIALEAGFASSIPPGGSLINVLGPNFAGPYATFALATLAGATGIPSTSLLQYWADGTFAFSETGLGLSGIWGYYTFASAIGLTNATLTLANANDIFNGALAISAVDASSVSNSAKFLGAVAVGDATGIGVFAAAWGLVTNDHITAFAGYLNQLGNAWIQSGFTAANANTDFEPFSRRFVTRDAIRYVLNYPDPLFDRIFVPTDTATFANHSSEEYARENTLFTSIGTGINDLNDFDIISVYNNLTELAQRSGATGFFCGGVAPIEGSWTPGVPPAEADGFFDIKPRLQKSDPVTLWNSDTLRPALFDYEKTESVKGVEAYRFGLDLAVIEPQALYDMTIRGVVNLQCVKGYPVRITLPRFYLADLHPSQIPEGVPDVVVEDNYIWLDIEPLTGATIRGFLRLQINLEVSGTPGHVNSTYIPVVWIEKTSELTNSQSDDFEDLITNTRDIWIPLALYGGVSIGSLLILIGILLVTLTVCQSRDTFIDNQEKM